MGRIAHSVLDNGGRVIGIIPHISRQARACAQSGAGTDRRRQYASAQAADVRARRRFHRAARRRRHAGGTGRATHLGATRSSRQARADRRYRRFLAPVAQPDRAYAQSRLHPRGFRRALPRRRKDRRRIADAGERR